LINVIREELRNIKLFILETLILTPPINKIKITVSKPGPLNANPKLIIVTQPVAKSEKLLNPLMFNGSQKDLRPFVTKLRLKLLVNYN